MRDLLQRIRYSRTVGRLRYHGYLTLLAFPKRRECNLCGWRGSSFLTYHHKRVLCPRCGSSIRHRLIPAAIEHRPDLSRGLRLEGNRILHLSPDYCLRQRYRPVARQYVAADYSTMNADVRMDATRLPFASKTFDAILACDVLEHVPDDRAALAEFRRVLRVGGVAVVTVPQGDGLEQTIEDPSVTTDEDRSRVYGQPDHVRICGADIAARLADAGFAVSTVTGDAFPPGIVRRHVLVPPVLRTDPFSWNHRRVYFAERV